MQLRLTVLGPQSGSGTGADVTVSAPAGTPLAAVLGGLAEAAAPGGGPPGAVFCGPVRLDPRRALLGRPPLVDGAVLAFQRPVEEAAAERARARLLVLSGPDAGGVHLLHGGEIRIGRSAQVEVPLDDPDVSRLHCVITVAPDGALTVHDPGSTNGTAVNGAPIDRRPVALPPDSELRVGESVLRIVADAETDAGADADAGAGAETGATVGAGGGTAGSPPMPAGPGAAAPPIPAGPGGTALDGGGSDGAAPGTAAPDRTTPGGTAPDTATPDGTFARFGVLDGAPDQPADTTTTIPGRRRRPGWARRLSGVAGIGTLGGEVPARPAPPPAAPGGAWEAEAARWPDPATVLLTAIESGPLLWARDAAHRDALTVRLGTAQRVAGPLVPVTVNLAAAGSLGLAGPRARLTALARSLLAQLAALHLPRSLEIVALAPGRAAEWSWLGWLPQTEPSDGQPCHRLLAFDREQAGARLAELTARLTAADGGEPRRRTVVLVDGELDDPRLRGPLTRLCEAGPAAGIHLLCLAGAPTATPASPLDDSLRAAAVASPPFPGCGMTGVLAGEVATAVRLLLPDGEAGPPATIDGVSPAWAERFARALAPLRESAAPVPEQSRRTALPTTARLLDVLELPRVTPGTLRERWATGSGLPLLLGSGAAGPLYTDLAAAPGPLLIDGPARSGRTELLCSLAASLAAARGPQELSLLLIDGAAEGLRPCAELPHVADRLRTTDPVRMREVAQALRAELNRRAALLGERDFDERALPEVPAPLRVVSPRPAGDDAPGAAGPLRTPGSGPLPRLVVLVDDLAALRSPALGDPGRPAAGSVVRALDAVVREGRRLGVQLIAAAGTAPEPAPAAPDAAPGGWQPALRVALTGHRAGHGELLRPAGTAEPFQAGRVTGRIPRTATLRPTVVPLDWRRAGDPPARRPVRELGNGPTDIALLASAAARAARSDATPAASPA
jgi:hypothetical protein